MNSWKRRLCYDSTDEEIQGSLRKGKKESVERQRKNADGKEEKQDEKGIAKQPTQVTRGARLKESQQKPRRDRPKKRERGNRRPSMCPKFRQEKQEQDSTAEGYPRRERLKSPYAVKMNYRNVPRDQEAPGACEDPKEGKHARKTERTDQGQQERRHPRNRGTSHR